MIRISGGFRLRLGAGVALRLRSVRLSVCAPLFPLADRRPKPDFYFLRHFALSGMAWTHGLRRQPLRQMIFQSLIGNCPAGETSGQIDAWPQLAGLQYVARFDHKPFCSHRFLPAYNSRTCHDPFYIERLFFHAALISAVFIRLLSALLVAPPQSRATKDSWHCIAFGSAARQREKQAQCLSFGTGLLSHVEAKRAIPFLQTRKAKI